MKKKPLKSFPPLSRRDFAQSFKKGQGRALKHVKYYGLKGIKDLVHQACLRTQAYDPECECRRASWLLEMIKEEPGYESFRLHIFRALTRTTKVWDLAQLLELTKLMALSGDKEAQHALHARVLRIARNPSDHESWGVEEWIDVSGVSGLLELARIYGRRLRKDPKGYVNEDIPLNGKRGHTFKEALHSHSQKDLEINAYWKYLHKRGVLNQSAQVAHKTFQKRARQLSRQRCTLTKILQDAIDGKGEFPGYYVTFGRFATKQELKTLFHYLLHCKNTKTRVRLLWVFRCTPAPFIDEKLFTWARGKNNFLREASIAALAQLSDNRIHALALEKLRNIENLTKDLEILDLFIRNYHPQDGKKITDTLLSLHLPEITRHSLGSSLLEIAEHNPDRSLKKSLLWTYEQTPCTNCRYQAVKNLKKIHGLSQKLLQECTFDVNMELQKLARRQLKILKEDANKKR